MSDHHDRGARVLLVGHDFVPERSSGDKNYWLALTAHLGHHVDWLGVASIVHGGPPHRQFAAGPTTVDLFNIEPVYALTRLLADREPHPPKCAGAFKRQPGSLTDHPLTLLRHSRRLRRIVRDHDVDVIHFMDNVGLGAGLTRALQRRAAVTMTYLGFYTVNRWRAAYLSGCARLASGLVVGNQHIGSALHDRVSESERTRVIPWGSRTMASADSADRERARRSLVHHHRLSGDRLILWSGHTQQFGEAELHQAMAAAVQVTEAAPGVEAVFLLKPECEPEKFTHLSTERIRVCSSADAPPFPDHLLGADVLLAPVARTNTIVTPPLTWIEAMQAGTPVVSTAAPGVAEALGPLQADLIAPVSEQPVALAEILAKTLDGSHGPSRPALEAWARDRFDLERGAAAYAEFWATMGPDHTRSSGA
ncbi:MAG: glycosyltransferase [Acidimicrobiales bacterium]